MSNMRVLVMHRSDQHAVWVSDHRDQHGVRRAPGTGPCLNRDLAHPGHGCIRAPVRRTVWAGGSMGRELLQTHHSRSSKVLRVGPVGPALPGMGPKARAGGRSATPLVLSMQAI